VSEAEISLACSSMGVREEVTQQVKGIARPSYASERRSHGDGDEQSKRDRDIFPNFSKEVEQNNGGEPPESLRCTLRRWASDKPS
jgi:hypothetical protein